MNKVNVLFRCIIRLLVVLIAALVCGALCIRLVGYGHVYETEDLNDYGKFVGNFDNDTPKQFIESFFPTQIESYFSEIAYHYKAKKGDTYSYEAYLEFVISDSEVFRQYLENTVQNRDCFPFRYDTAFTECTISNVYYLSIDPSNPNLESTTCQIRRAEVGLILYSEAEQRIIFVAIGHYDGGGTKANELSFFFNKFGIDPADFATHAFSSPWEQRQSKIY